MPLRADDVAQLCIDLELPFTPPQLATLGMYVEDYIHCIENGKDWQRVKLARVHSYMQAMCDTHILGYWQLLNFYNKLQIPPPVINTDEMQS